VLRISRTELGRLRLFRTSTEININRIGVWTPSDDFVADIQHNEQQQADVSREKVRRAPRRESLEALGEDDEDVEADAVPGEVGLQHGLVWQAVT
jgi:hypothetical protein